MMRIPHSLYVWLHPLRCQLPIRAWYRHQLAARTFDRCPTFIDQDMSRLTAIDGMIRLRHGLQGNDVASCAVEG